MHEMIAGEDGKRIIGSARSHLYYSIRSSMRAWYLMCDPHHMFITHRLTLDSGNPTNTSINTIPTLYVSVSSIGNP